MVSTCMLGGDRGEHIGRARVRGRVKEVVVGRVMLHVIVPQDLDVLGVRDGDAGQILDAAVDLFEHGVACRGQEVLRRGAEFLGCLACGSEVIRGH